MIVKKIIPRSYCHGVVEAINLTVSVCLDDNTKKPIHLLGELVHNKSINEVFSKFGVITHEAKDKKRIDLLDEIDDNDGTVIFTAHGVSDLVKQKANDKGLIGVDATCSDVTNTFNLIKKRIQEGYDVIYIGKYNHPESVAAHELDKTHVHFVETKEDVDNLIIENEKIVITNQTTLSLWDVANVADYIQSKYKTSVYEREICDATQTRQVAVVETAKDVDLIIIVGDPKSNNSNKLVEVAKKITNTNAILIESVLDLKDYDFTNVNSVGVSAGASTPPLLVKDVIKFLNNPNEFDMQNYKINLSKLVPKLKI